MASMGLPTSLRAFTAETNGDEYKVGVRSARNDVHSICARACGLTVAPNGSSLLQVWSTDPAHIAQSLRLREDAQRQISVQSTHEEQRSEVPLPATEASVAALAEPAATDATAVSLSSDAAAAASDEVSREEVHRMERRGEGGLKRTRNAPRHPLARDT